MKRKISHDSMSYVPDLSWLLWWATGDSSLADDQFVPAARAILATVATEQHHEERSPYVFRRSGVPAQDTLDREGRGSLTTPNGLVWAGFRPSDDAFELGYNIPGNHFLALALDRLGDLLEYVAGEGQDAAEARRLSAEILGALDRHGVIEGPDGGQVRAYEIDGRGNHELLERKDTSQNNSHVANSYAARSEEE